MPLSRSTRLIVGFAAMIVPALIHAGPPGAAQPTERASLAGQVLIASPTMGDPRFRGTVILLVRHNRNGAFGIAINRPAGERPLADVLTLLGESGTNIEGRVRIFLGGPVQPELAFVVHSAEYRRAETLVIDGRLAMTSSRELLRDIAGRKGPDKALIAFGYSGWRAGQLEDEMRRQSWFTAPADPKLVFDDDRDKVWHNAMERRQLDL